MPPVLSRLAFQHRIEFVRYASFLGLRHSTNELSCLPSRILDGGMHLHLVLKDVLGAFTDRIGVLRSISQRLLAIILGRTFPTLLCHFVRLLSCTHTRCSTAACGPCFHTVLPRRAAHSRNKSGLYFLPCSGAQSGS